MSDKSTRLDAILEDARGPRGALRRLLGSSLTRNGYALMVSTVLTSGLGMVFWILAARLYSQTEVGLGGILISTVVTLSSAARMSFNNVLQRFLPVSGNNSKKLLYSSYGFGIICGLVLAVGFIIFADHFVPELAFLAHMPLLALAFGASIAIWTIFSLQESALSALRESVWVPLINALYAISKILMLVAFIGVAGYGMSLLGTWMVPLVLSILVTQYFLMRHLLPPKPMAGQQTAPISRTHILRFFGWDYLAGLSMTIAVGIAPILVINTGGPESSAQYHITWTITYSLVMLGRAMGVSLLAESVVNAERIPALIGEAIVQSILPVTLAALLISISAPWLMALFGAEYTVEGTHMLRVLALSAIPWGFISIFLALARAKDWVRAMAAVQWLTLVFVVAASFLLLPVLGPVAVAYGWLIAQTLVAVIICIVGVALYGRERSLNASLNLATAAARFLRGILGSKPAADHNVELDEFIASATNKLGASDGQEWRVLNNEIRSQDSLTLTLARVQTGAEVPSQPNVCLKIAWSTPGIDALTREMFMGESLRSNPRLQDLKHLLPQTLFSDRHASALMCAEAVLPGRRGSSVLFSPDANRISSLADAARAITAIHHATATEIEIAQDWKRRWINAPLAILGAHGTPRARTSRQLLLPALEAHMSDFWLGRTLPLGASHGNFSPGNLLFEHNAKKDARGLTHLRLTGILDWDHAEYDAPQGFDICTLALITRTMAEGQELGPIVHELLGKPSWRPAERSWFGPPPDGSFDWHDDPQTIRHLVILAWLHHVSANLDRSEASRSNKLWLGLNVDWVLRKITRTKA
ncbi:phosphotransferase [Pelagibacterium lentulum]|uniref:Aminoglycoside phosphotransferase domain-containing protein n=1 Tax=Pelagibacterium lentulum TaxID=2029865 RepID=A0A916RFZ5_9HYPH|nr:phosphotransferase [Pelagibacterium lentulum]GGA52963.1 hypothetical protein GCM10011499_23860 [Pelagibacterium lentulum]